MLINSLICRYIIFIKCIQTLVRVHVYYMAYYSIGSIQYSIYRRTFDYHLAWHDSRFSYVLECTLTLTDHHSAVIAWTAAFFACTVGLLNRGHFLLYRFLLHNNTPLTETLLYGLPIVFHRRLQVRSLQASRPYFALCGASTCYHLLLYTAWTMKAWRSYLNTNQPFYPPTPPRASFTTGGTGLEPEWTYIGAIFTIQLSSITLLI